jgi:predicted nuclease of predicted toxin-antitoxin system
MKIKLDENLPIDLKKVLVLAGHDVHSVRDERLEGHPDREVWESAQRESRFFLTQDLGFADLRSFSPGSHSGILLLRLQPADRRDMIQTNKCNFSSL